MDNTCFVCYIAKLTALKNLPFEPLSAFLSFRIRISTRRTHSGPLGPRLFKARYLFLLRRNWRSPRSLGNELRRRCFMLTTCFVFARLRFFVGLVIVVALL